MSTDEQSETEQSEQSDREQSDREQTDREQSDSAGQDDASEDSEDSEDSPAVDDEKLEEAKEKVASIEERYEPGARPTVTVEGTGGTVAGTAFADDEDIVKHQAKQSEPEDSDS